MDFAYAKLKGRIVERYGTRGKFAEAIGLSETSVSRKLNGASSFSQADIVLWSEVLGISLADVGLYFYS